MKKSQIIQSIKEVLAEEKPGLWANIRSKRARGEKPAHKNSKAHKDAVAAGKKINAMSEQGKNPVNQLIPQLDKISSELAALDQKKYQKAISYISDAILDLVQK